MARAMAERMRIKKMIGVGLMKVWMEGILLGCFDCFDPDTDKTSRMKDAQRNEPLDFEGDVLKEEMVEIWRR